MRATRWGVLVLHIIATILIVTTATVVSQTTPRLEWLEVDLWPEYDRPEMLIIYRSTLPAETPLPATLTLRLPARVGEPHAVAYDDGTGALIEANYSTTTSGEWRLVTLETPTSNFQLEFYDDLGRTDDRRDYTFVWPGDYAVDQLSFQLLPPPEATEIQSEPVLSPVQQDTGSLVYVRAPGSFAVGQEARLEVSYRGTSTQLSGNALQPTRDGKNRMPLVAGSIAAVLLLVIGGGIWYTRRLAPAPAKASPPQRRPKRPRSQRRRAQRRARPAKLVTDQGKPSAQRPSSAGYCTHCGNPLRAEDRFCGGCGTPVTQ